MQRFDKNVFCSIFQGVKQPKVMMMMMMILKILENKLKRVKWKLQLNLEELELHALQTCFCALFDSLLGPELYHHRVTKLQPQDRPDKTQQHRIRTCE